jgi:DNA-3-methyladenine glycosylase II
MIRIKGHLGPTLLSAFPAMAWKQQGPETVLTGTLDQPGLHGVLAEIEALSLDLLEVRQLTDWLEQARSQLRTADPVLATLIAAQPDFDPRQWMNELPAMDRFGALLFQIVGQQLSVAATRRILERIEERFGGRLPSAADVLATDPARFRDAGLSWRKVSTLRDLAERLSDGRLDPKALTTAADDELIAALTQIPGIGPWTAQGALIIGLGREDVVLPGDLALRKAVRTVYALDHLPAEDEVLAIAEKWRPYRSLATAYLFSAAFDEGQALARRARAASESS